MIYVKTKSGIVACETVADLQTKVIFRDNFVGSSDNLADLCDCYALEDCVDPIRGLFLFKSFTFAKLEAKKRNERLFGYIIVEKKGAKALEPVAVMNEKGDLKLL